MFTVMQVKDFAFFNL